MVKTYIKPDTKMKIKNEQTHVVKDRKQEGWTGQLGWLRRFSEVLS